MPVRRAPADRFIWTIVNAAPVAQDQALTTLGRTPVAIDLTAADSDPLTYKVGAPARGVLLGIPPALTYIPDSGFAGIDSFTFRANDGLVDSAIATVTVETLIITDVSIVKQVTPALVGPGGAVSYTLAFSNTGTELVSGVTISDSLPVSVTVTSVASSTFGGGAIVQTSGAPNYAWTVSDLPAGAGGVITLTGAVSAGLNADAVLTNTAAITVAADINPANNVAAAGLRVTVPRVAFGASAYRVGEGDGLATMTVTLDAINPYAPVAVIVQSSNGSATASTDYGAITQTVTIPAGAQQATVAVPIVNDAVDEADETLSLALSAPVGGALGAAATTTVTIADDDTASVTVNPTLVSASEPGATEDYTLVLNSQPTAAVTITVSGDGQTTATPGQVVFTPLYWSIPQAVTVGAVQDVVAESQHPGVISHTAASADANYNNMQVVAVNVTIADDDSPCVCITPINVTVSEAGVTDTYRMRLTTQPGAVVTVTLVLTDGQIAASPLELVFTPANWSDLQTVTVTAVDDALVEGAMQRVIAHAVTSDDPDYAAIDDRTVTVNIAGSDTAGVVVNPTSGLTTTEAGGTATFSVMLQSAPTAPVTVALASGDASEGAVSPTELVFTAANWFTAQTATVTGVNDAVDDGDVAYAIVTAISSGDPLYAAIDPADVGVTNLDDDGAALAMSKLASVATANVGDVVVYTFRITNTGTVLLNNVSAVDDKLGTVALDATSLAPGAAASGLMTYTVQAGDLPGPLVNTVTATALSAGGNPVQAQTGASVNLVNAAFAFAKTVGILGITPECTAATDLLVPVNTTMVYCFRVANTGAAGLLLQALTDSHLGNLPLPGDTVVAPGESYIVSATATLTESVTNVATLTAGVAADASRSAFDVIVARTTSATARISAATDDQDGDSIPDNVEGAGDVDGDNVPNFLDEDADGDGIPDRQETGPDPANPVDSDGDGIPNFLDPDQPTALEPGEEPAMNNRMFLPLVNR